MVLLSLVSARSNSGQAPVAPTVIQGPQHAELLAAIRAHDAVQFARLLDRAQPQEITVLLLSAIERCDAAIAKLLLAHGANPNVGIDGPAETPLIGTARVGCWEVTDMLLTAGAHPDGRAGFVNRAQFPLYAALYYRHRRVAVILLRAGANPNARYGIGDAGRLFLGPGQGQTPLMEAARQGDVEMVESLLGSGADPTLTDEKGRRAIDWLKQHQAAVDRISTRLSPPPKR
jgi:hypothetical protein